jgi:hypothetical protein
MNYDGVTMPPLTQDLSPAGVHDMLSAAAHILVDCGEYLREASRSRYMGRSQATDFVMSVRDGTTRCVAMRPLSLLKKSTQFTFHNPLSRWTALVLKAIIDATKSPDGAVTRAAVRLVLQRSEALDTRDDLAPYLCMAHAPEPDLFIRTGGEQRISNFLLWQLAYTELYFTETFWPDFNAAALDEAIASYQQRERRFGRTSAQLIEVRKAS